MNIFDNTQQKGLSEMNQQIESEKALKSFDDWYKTLPKWTEEEMQREAEDHINEDLR